jgi:hypothetical protein
MPDTFPLLLKLIFIHIFYLKILKGGGLVLFMKKRRAAAVFHIAFI